MTGFLETNPEAYVQVVIARFGGPKRFFAIQAERHARLTEAWAQDADVIGRVVRCHLFVEHFMDDFLDSHCHALSPPSLAGLTFNQKISLLPKEHVFISPLTPGVKRINQIRNRIAHTLRADLSGKDAQVFTRIELFAEFRKVGGDAAVLTGSPLLVLESFAQYVGMTMAAAAASDAALWDPPSEAELQTLRDGN